MAALVKFHCCVRTTLLVVFFLHASNFVKGSGGSGQEIEWDDGNQPSGRAPAQSGYYSQPALPSRSGYPRIYGDLNFPSGGRLYPLPFGGRGGILESRAVPRYSNYNYNSYGSYQQQNRNNGMNPLLAMWAFDMW
ncbi:hypothetical protein BaRGS_00039034 [Batillaria attramentaria]|uniref:Secreted protein n=1 Tax=Batillaria attramentaria TaxID=370345 RepID=A0ABD0J4R9_9CAEN